MIATNDLQDAKKTNDPGNIKILLVEDDESIGTALSYSLVKEGYEVTLCINARQTYQRMDLFDYDLAILDVTLPDGNGFEIYKKLQEKRDTPSIFLTAKSEECNIVFGLDLGADDYITKPFRLSELHSRIRSVLRRSIYRSNRKSGMTGTYCIEDITISISQGKVTKNNEELFLSSQEYKLLLMFAKNMGKILTRDTILYEIWDTGCEYVNDNTLSVHIKRLREKIGDDPKNPHIIKTIRGIGYMV